MKFNFFNLSFIPFYKKKEKKTLNYSCCFAASMQFNGGGEKKASVRADAGKKGH